MNSNLNLNSKMNPQMPKASVHASTSTATETSVLSSAAEGLNVTGFQTIRFAQPLKSEAYQPKTTGVGCVPLGGGGGSPA